MFTVDCDIFQSLKLLPLERPQNAPSDVSWGPFFLACRRYMSISRSICIIFMYARFGFHRSSRLTISPRFFYSKIPPPVFLPLEPQQLYLPTPGQFF